MLSQYFLLKNKFRHQISVSIIGRLRRIFAPPSEIFVRVGQGMILDWVSEPQGDVRCGHRWEITFRRHRPRAGRRVHPKEAKSSIRKATTVSPHGHPRRPGLVSSPAATESIHLDRGRNLCSLAGIIRHDPGVLGEVVRWGRICENLWQSHRQQPDSRRTCCQPQILVVIPDDDPTVHFLALFGDILTKVSYVGHHLADNLA